MSISIKEIQQHRRYMRQALNLAGQASDEDEIPVGAVVVHDNKIIGRGYNQTERLNDATAHAEMIAVTAACSTLKQKYLAQCTLYVTLEPCPMCTGALVWTKIDRVIFGASDAQAGACGSVFNLAENEKLNHHIEIIQGILEDECSLILKQFFANKRSNGTDTNNKT